MYKPTRNLCLVPMGDTLCTSITYQYLETIQASKIYDSLNGGKGANQAVAVGKLTCKRILLIYWSSRR